MKDTYTKKWIIENSLEIIKGYDKGILTIRGLHYRLVAIGGMTNDTRHYKRIVNAMGSARWDGLIDFDTFSDLDRFMIGETEYKDISLEDKIEEAKEQIGIWMTSYSRNKWQNQYYYPEVLIEKKALQSVFMSVCKDWNVTLGACKGYPSLTFLYDITNRLIKASKEGYHPIILYFGDYDPSGEDIVRSIKEKINNLGCFDVEVKRIALMKEQVIEWKLPPALVKSGDPRSATWTGLGQVELDAIEPNKLQALCREAIKNIFDENVAFNLRSHVQNERIRFRSSLKEYVSTL
jgi:hypothetical protein